jgi:hypothetical protein
MSICGYRTDRRHLRGTLASVADRLRPEQSSDAHASAGRIRRDLHHPGRVARPAVAVSAAVGLSAGAPSISVLVASMHLGSLPS